VKAPWRPRKERYLAHLAELVADQHPAVLQPLRRAAQRAGDRRLTPAAAGARRFAASPVEVAGYYRSLLRTYRTSKALPRLPLAYLTEAVGRLEALATE
jgi:hypothetical protein